MIRGEHGIQCHIVPYYKRDDATDMLPQQLLIFKLLCVIPLQNVPDDVILT